MIRSGIFILVLGALLAACAHGSAKGDRWMSDSGGSDSNSEGSSDSSQGGSGGSSDSEGSENSSNQSEDSSNESTETSDESAASTNNSDERTEQSSNESTQDSTDDTSSRGEDPMTNGPVLTTAGVLVTGAAVGVVLWLRADAMAPKRAAAAGEVTRRWLAANAHQLALDLALGAGPALEDLAGAADIPPAHQSIFGRVLRRHRDELIALCDPEALTRERALVFLERVGEIARTHPALAEDYRRFVERRREDDASPPG